MLRRPITRRYRPNRAVVRYARSCVDCGATPGRRRSLQSVSPSSEAMRGLNRGTLDNVQVHHAENEDVYANEDCLHVLINGMNENAMMDVGRG